MGVHAANVRGYGMRMLPALTVGLIAIAPLVGAVDAYIARLIMLTAIMSLMVSGLNLVLGYAGQFAVSQVAVYALGAYGAAYLSVHAGIDDALVALVAVSLAAVALGLITGIPSLRLEGWGLAMATFFLVLIVPNVVEVLSDWTGGALGTSVPTPTLFGAELSQTGFYLLLVTVTTCWFVFVRNLVLSRRGHVLLAIRESPILAASLGYSVYRTKLLVYVLSAIPAGLAGAMLAWLDGYLAPESFTFSVALQVLAASVIGGTRSIYGALIGAGIVVVGLAELAAFDSLLMIMWGSFLIVTGVLFSGGISGLTLRMVRRLGHRTAPPGDDAQSAARAAVDARDFGTSPTIEQEPLVIAGLNKRFGGNVAVHDVSLRAEPAEVTAFIGPNGSGKTTLLNLVNGFYQPDSGSVSLGELRLSGQSADKVARAGVVRTFQTPLMPEGINVRDFVALARTGSRGRSLLATILRLPAYRRARREDASAVAWALDQLDLRSIASEQVADLPLGTRRMVEMARVLVSGARLVLLDEVGSGLDAGELVRLGEAVDLVRGTGATVVLVEHNLPFVLETADRVHVLSSGALLASGTPEEIQADPSVLAEYTGRRQEEPV